MIRKTIGLVVVDEIDNTESQATKLGDFRKVVRERLVAAEESGLFYATGTPTTQYAAGWQMLEDSDFRRYHVPCPLCGTYQHLVLPRLKWDVVAALRVTAPKLAASLGAMPDAERAMEIAAKAGKELRPRPDDIE